MFAALTMSLALVAAPVPAEGEDAKALTALQGTWKLVAVEEKGGKLEDIKDKDMRFTFKGNGLLWREDNGEVNSFTVKLDTSKTPAHIDITAKLKDGPGRTAYAVYAVKGNRLTICFGRNATPDEPEDRPRELKTGDSSERPQKGKLLFVFERVKDK